MTLRTLSGLVAGFLAGHHGVSFRLYQSPAPYVAGTLLAVRKVADAIGVRRGLDSLLFED